tara:strand:- start:1034 stop:1864 length:831 start_codon:yes stop_codon:yes gene_type:complete
MKIGVLHPGEMGSSIGDCLIQSGHEVFWASSERSQSSRDRAATWQEKSKLSELVEEVDAILSVCPPSEARALANEVLDLRFRGIYVDANAIAPQTASEILNDFGSNYVDGGLIGPPAREKGSTRLYLSGKFAREVGSWFDTSLLEAKVIATEMGVQASSLKMAYAGYTKGSSALLILINAFAELAGVRESLVKEWEMSQPALIKRSEHAAKGTAAKAWRFVGEMEEIAKTMKSSDLPEGFHNGSAELYSLMARFKDAKSPDLNEVLEEIISLRNRR